MGESMRLVAKDGHKFGAYLAQPAGKAKGGVVVVQEIFGVNAHIRETCELFAGQGYLAVAPALFDRAKPDVQLGYQPDDIAAGRDIRGLIKNEDALLDIAEGLGVAMSAGKVGIVGYCWGGTLTYLAACRIDGFAAASGYYGGGIGGFKGEAPKCPTMMHFGEQDHAIPMDEVNGFKAARSEVQVFTYPAGHGFNCDHRGSYHPESTKIARERTFDHFAKHVG